MRPTEIPAVGAGCEEETLEIEVGLKTAGVLQGRTTPPLSFIEIY